ncbi:peptidylprolyl isomerase [Aliishimia ponticola]|uniref:Parvulin-like PPIase n=1 Tax=Aliishimia ponticola TaxID=2499833 RepID=A0A4S4N6C7_9RHOB|nr:peptidylprolyl isomerase [Aliishimia ponticola]THH34686.1 peptidylprolyl isomerase [Aliishimia ponticola]
MHDRLKKPLAAALLAVMALVPAAHAEDQPDLGQVVATVNGTDITLGHIAVAKSTLPDQYRNLPAEVLFPGILDQLIQQTTLMQSMNGERPARVQLALDNEMRSLMAGEAVENVMANAVTPDLLEEAYEEVYGGDEETKEYNAAHILVETQEEAQAIKAELDDGADFAVLAKEKSTGPSGPRGGDLGWFGKGMMVPAFELAVLEMEEGAVSEPVETRFGWHVILLKEIRTKAAPVMEEVREELEQKIRTDAVTAHIEQLVTDADIDRTVGDEIDPTVLDQIDLTKTE